MIHFVTTSGSRYVLDGRSTVRTKRGGAVEQPSQWTFFVSRRMAPVVLMWLRTDPYVRIVVEDDKLYLRLQGKKQLLATKLQPEIGSHPLEIWDGGDSWHVGTAIVQVMEGKDGWVAGRDGV